MAQSSDESNGDRGGGQVDRRGSELGWDWESSEFDWLKDVEPEDLPIPRHRELFEYYRELKGERDLPFWSDFDPVRVPRILPWLIVYDVVGEPPRFRVRLQGSRMVESWGADITGQFLDELPKWNEVIERFTWLAQERLPYLTKSLRTKMAPLDFKSLTALALPFTTGGEGVDIIVGCVFYDN